MLEETNASGVAQADYIYLNGRPVAVLNGSTLYYLHDDRLGTPQVATDSSQNTQWQTSYEPFGQTSSVSGTITQNLRFPGQYFDVESGWNHNGFRDYVPELGRYIQPDPLGRLGSGNDLFAYVYDNPANLIDPLGLCAAMNHAANNPCGSGGSARQIAFGFGGTVIAPFAGGSAGVSVGANIDWWSSSVFIQGQASGGLGGGAFAGYGLTGTFSKGAAPTTGFGSASYAEADAGFGPGFTGSVAHDENGCTSYGGSAGVMGGRVGEGAGLGIFAGKQGTATVTTPSIGSIVQWFVDHQEYF